MVEELDSKIIEWAKSNPIFVKYLNNYTLLKIFYSKYHKATKVKDCVEGVYAELELLVAKLHKPRPVMLCAKCGKKKCDQQNCGADEYKERNGYSYTAGDNTGSIYIGVAPFKDEKIPILKEESIYKVKGNITQYKDKLTIEVDEVEEIKVESTVDLSPIISIVVEMLKLYSNKVEKSKWTAFVSNYQADHVAMAMIQLGLKEENGYIVKV